MLLSRHQQYALDILNRLGCLRKSQLEAFLQREFFDSGKQIHTGFADTLFKQFRFCNIAMSCEDDVIFLPGRRANDRFLEAVDVMLELSDGRPMDFAAFQPEPVLLRFSVDGKRISLFAVLHEDDLKTPGVRSPPELHPTERVVILLSGEKVPPPLSVSNTQFYAIRQQDGTHRFFAANNKRR